MANTENLKSYVKGQSGNPGGRPRGSRNVSTVLASMLSDIAPDIVIDASFIRDISKGLKKATIADAAAARLVYEGVVNGQSWALKELLDRTEGKAKQSIEISSESKIERLAEAIKKTNEMACTLNREYGVPMPSDDEVVESLRNIAEANGVSEKELAMRLSTNPAD